MSKIAARFASDHSRISRLSSVREGASDDDDDDMASMAFEDVTTVKRSGKNSKDVDNDAPNNPQEKRSKKKGDVARFGDIDLIFKSEEDEDKATWAEIREACCHRSQHEWIMTLVYLIVFTISLYWSLFGLALLGVSAQVLFGCKVGELFDHHINAVSSLMIGILATVLLQSSGTSIGIFVMLVQQKVVSLDEAIYMVMGANIGTTVTCALVSLAELGKVEPLERAFTAATVHDMFNCLTVLVLFPLECATGYLSFLTEAIVAGAETGRHQKHYDGPITKYVTPLVHRLIVSNPTVIKGVAAGRTCDSFYPTYCNPGVPPSFETCRTGLVACDKDTGRCPLFFKEDAEPSHDLIAGAVCFAISIIVLFVAMFGLIYSIQKYLHGMSVKVVYTVTHWNGYIGIIVGTAITIALQSSSIVTSLLVPFAGVGALRIEQIYPLVLGANLGTAVQLVIRSKDLISIDALQVALSQLFFNVTGVILFYPIPHMRQIPIWISKRLGRGAVLWRLFPVAFIISSYILVPLFFLALSIMFTSGKAGLIATASILSAASGAFVCWVFWRCKFMGGDEKFKMILAWLRGLFTPDDASPPNTHMTNLDQTEGHAPWDGEDFPSEQVAI